MEPQVQASFIPKRPLTPSVTSARGNGLLQTISIIIFAASVLAAGVAFSYETYMSNSIKTQEDSLTRAQAAYDPAVIENLVRLDSRIVQSQTLLKNHLAPTGLFSFLEANTLSTVRWTSFDYGVNQNGAATLSLGGEALDFSSVALQSDALSASKALKDTMFTDINVDPATSHVVFKVSALIDPSILLFRTVLPAAPALTQ